MPNATNTARLRPGRFILIAALLVLIAAAVWRSMRADAPIAPDDTPAASESQPPLASGLAPVAEIVDRSTVTSTTRAATDATTTAQWPASLRDSEPDGSITLDAAGRVHPTLELRRLFDYFLSAIGEADLAAIRALLLAHVRSLHGDGVAADVGGLFDRYVAYQQSLAAMPATPEDSLRDRLARVRALRRQLLDATTADAFFGAEESYTEHTLDRRDVFNDATLDEATRTRRLAELDATLTAEQRAQMQQANSALLVDEQNRQFDALQLGPAQRHAEREALFGADAARRLALVDAERSAWDRRVAAYRQARDAIRADARLTGSARDRMLGDLRARSFDAAELRRIGSLEAIGAL